jgi:hypothetical protein
VKPVESQVVTQGGAGSGAGAASRPAPAGVAPAVLAGAGVGQTAAAREFSRGDLVAGASWLSLGLSLCLHTLIVLTAVLVGSGGGFIGLGGGDQAGSAEFEMTLTAETPLSGMSETPLDATAPSVAPADAQLADVVTAGVLEGAGGVDAPGAGEGLGAISDGLGGAGGGDIGSGEGLGSGGMGGGGASFFGVEAKGARFAYIVDISGSMRGEKLQALKAELRESIGALQTHQSFYIAFFSSDAVPLDDKRKWVSATDANKRWATERIMGVDASGGTVPWPAFDLIFSMRPAPDAIYFMTDGIFDPEVADKIQVRNSGGQKVPVHAISFVDRSAEELMRRIGAQSGGSYSHIEGPRK